MEVAPFPFPCPLERKVASALLLLSNSPPSISPPSSAKRCKSDGSESLFALSCGNSKSCVSTSSTVTNDDGSSPEIRGGRQFRLARRVDRFHELTTMKVVRKSRSKTFWISDSRKTSSGNPATIQSFTTRTASAMTETSSCLSTESSSVSTGRSSNSNAAATKIVKEDVETTSSLAQGKKRKPACSGLLTGRCEAIMKVLSDGCCISEVRIRQLLGDSPDTSKALRMLLKREEVTRSGAGGRTDPYIYKRA